jgi:dihydrofolate synthase/folylpolyglutamate synthase
VTSSQTGGALRAPEPEPRSDALLARLKELHPRVIDLSLGRIETLLAKLGDPHTKLPPVVHVAGTNGKGSAIAFLKAIAEAKGLKVHVYTSPHLVRFHERIALAGEGGAAPIGEDHLVEILGRAEAANAGGSVTFFEITTAAAFLAFSETPADLVLLETGLGGRLDATNLIERPALTLIMPVSIDHVQFLGETLPEIAREKAGILKPGVTSIVARQDQAALDVIEARAERIDAPLIVAGRDFDCFMQQGRLLFQTEQGVTDLPPPRLMGSHQTENAGAAIAAAFALFGAAGLTQALERGLAGAVWPARLERLSGGALNAIVGEDAELWLDGGHNRAGGVALARAMGEIEERVPRPLTLIWGMMATKDSGAFLASFAGLARRVLTVHIPGEENAFSAEELAAIARGEGFEAEACPDLFAALDAARSDAPSRVLICGSLYLAGEALRLQGR